jgi:arylsulfatase A-like enzyme
VRPPTGSASTPRVYDDLFSGVDLLPTLLELLGVAIPEEVQGISHAPNLRTPQRRDRPVRTEVYTTKTYHDSFDPIRAVRTKDYSYIENYATRPVLDLPWDIADSAPGQAVEPLTRGPRPARELYDLDSDPSESENLLTNPTDKADAIAGELALLLDAWRVKTNDVIPSDFAGTRIAERYTDTYLNILGRDLPSRSAIAIDRGVRDELQQ